MPINMILLQMLELLMLNKFSHKKVPLDTNVYHKLDKKTITTRSTPMILLSHIFFCLIGVASDSYVVLDGSGLSRHDLISPQAEVETLIAMTTVKDAAIFRSMLP